MKSINIIILILLTTTLSFSQTKIDQERMDRDIEIAENALATIIKQQYEKRNMWLEVKGNYTPGFGVTMRLPNDNSNWIFEYGLRGAAVIAPRVNANGVAAPVVVYSGSGSNDSYERAAEKEDREAKEAKGRNKDRSDDRRVGSRDSARAAYYGAMIKASKDFLADYGDLISQLQPEEKILITNRGEGGRYYYNWDKPSQKRSLVTIEATKGDISSFRQGKITRDQMMSKIKVVNTETTNEVETDLELLSSIMGRLYRSDLAKTYYTDENIYYERLKDFGVIYYMTAYSSTEQNRVPGDNQNNSQNKGRIWAMPTQHLEGLTQEQRDKKVIELYPLFEKELKENIVEYAQTVKSLKDEEMIVFNVQLTKCVGCNIPSTLELSLKNGLVRKLASGQTSKADVVNSINVKKGVSQ